MRNPFRYRWVHVYYSRISQNRIRVGRVNRQRRFRTHWMAQKCADAENASTRSYYVNVEPV